MWRTVGLSISGSYAGRIAPPGMPKTTSTPAVSSARTRLCAPVIVSGATGREPGLGPGCGTARPAVAMAAPSRWYRHEKTPLPRRDRGGARRTTGFASSRAPAKYDVLPHAVTVLPGAESRQSAPVIVSASGRRDHASDYPHTAPPDADPTSLAYLASCLLYPSD